MADRAEYPEINGGAAGLEQAVMSLVGFVNGEPGDDEFAAFPFRPVYSGAAPTIDLVRTTAGTTARLRANGVNHLTLEPAGATSAIPWSLPSLATSGDVSVGDDLAVAGDLDVAGIATLATLVISGDLTVGDDLTVMDDLLVGGDAIITGGGSFGGSVTFNGAAQFNVTSQFGNENTDTLFVVGLLRVQNAAASVTSIYADPANQRVILGSQTALGSDTTPAVHVVGRLYVAPDSANDLALQVRRSAAATVGWNLGVTSDNDLVFKDDAGNETFRVGDTASTYQAKVTNNLWVGDDIEVVDAVRAARGVFGGTAFAGSEELRVIGQTQLDGGVTISASGLTVQAGGISVTGSSAFNNAVSLTGGLTVNTVGISLANTLSYKVQQTSAFARNGMLMNSSDILEIGEAGITGVWIRAGAGLSFFTTSSPAGKQTVSGSRGGNAALASLLTALATYGLVTDSSS